MYGVYEGIFRIFFCVRPDILWSLVSTSKYYSNYPTLKIFLSRHFQQDLHLNRILSIHNVKPIERLQRIPSNSKLVTAQGLEVICTVAQLSQSVLFQ